MSSGLAPFILVELSVVVVVVVVVVVDDDEDDDDDDDDVRETEWNNERKSGISLPQSHW